MAGFAKAAMRAALVSVLLVAGTLVAPAPAFASVVICNGSAVPDGYVIIENLNLMGCGGTGAPNARRIDLPVNNIGICPNSPVPAGWVVIENLSLMGCGGTGGPNARRLYTPVNGIWICVNSPLPAGWVVIATGSIMACGTSKARQILHV